MTLARLALLFCLSATCGAQSLPDWRPLPEAPAKRAAPAQLASLQRLPPGAVSRWQRGGEKALGELELRLPDGMRYALSSPHAVRHANGDLSIAAAIAGAGADRFVLITQGREASFGTWLTPQGEFRFEAWGDEAWLVDLSHPGLRLEAADDQALGEVADLRTAAAAADKNGPAAIIDMLVVYSQGFAERYPGSGSETRVNHLIALTNQILANSGVAAVVRLAGAQLVTYPDSEGPNGTALERMRNALAGVATHPGFSTLRQQRDQLGADIVSFLRPHDIETRGNCGIAYFPTGAPEVGVHVVSDGFSSWSVCGEDVLAHELGHNLGAEHQNGQNSPNAGFGTAHVVPGQFHTIMGSFGTGSPDRYRRLMRFSNPEQLCGGRPCGVPNQSDNARRLRDNLVLVSGYRPPAAGAPAVQAPPAIDPDTDGDGVPDSQDAFPFDPRYHSDRDGDGVPDEIDAFPDDPAEWADTDGDGIGDNADPDRDGDGVPNDQDAFPLDPSEWVDSDGDGVGDNGDAFPQDRREWRDSDGDGVGDNADADADGDGVPDVRAGTSLAETDLLVVSAGTDRVLRFDADTGLFAGVEVAGRGEPIAFGPQAGLAWNRFQKRLYVLQASEVQRIDRASRQRIDRFVRVGPGGLASGFPMGLNLLDDGTVLLVDASVLSPRRHEAIDASPQPGGSFFQSGVFASYPRAAALDGSGRYWVAERDGRLSEFDAATGQLLRRFIPRIGAAFTPLDPTALAVGPDGRSLFLADGLRDRVLRIDPAQPDAATAFIAPGAGGLSFPTGLAFGPDGNLYASSSGNDRILRFDGSSGAPLGRFDIAPPGRLQQPRALLFLPKVADRFPRDAQRRYAPVAGGWYNPARSGHGIDLQRSGGNLALVWYTYEPGGRPVWYLGVGPLQGDTWQADLLRFRWQDGRAQPSVVGSASLVFADERQAEFAWTLPEGSGSEPFRPLALGRSSESQFPTAAWYHPAESGWGLSLTRQGEIDYAMAFVYDAAGEPVWFGGAALDGEDPTRFDMLWFDGPDRCPSCSGPRNAEASPGGSLRFAASGLDGAALESALDGGDVTWTRAALGFQRLTDTPTDVNGDPLIE